jgi:hypothetical protein
MNVCFECEKKNIKKKRRKRNFIIFYSFGELTVLTTHQTKITILVRLLERIFFIFYFILWFLVI